MMNELAADTAPPPQSPWKKPKGVTLLKSNKSLKRKSDMFNNSGLNNSDFHSPQTSFSCQPDIEEQSPKNRKISLFNRFSISKNSLNLSYGFSNNVASPSINTGNSVNSEKNDLYSFFNSSKRDTSNADETAPNLVTDENSSAKNKTSDNRLSSINPEFVKNACVSLINNSLILNTESTATRKELAAANIKVNYQYEHKRLIPIDWSLKNRIRIVSPKPFTCVNNIKSQQESEAILNYSKFNSFYDHLNQCELKSGNQDMFKTLFCESISLWMFPYLPWLNLYPRNAVFSNLSSEPLNVEIQKSLSKSWNNSLKSLYNSLKSNQCPYFYVLTHSFTVLFKAQNIGETGEMCAILTPSTKGLRQTLQDINFTMPLASNSAQILASKKTAAAADESCSNDFAKLKYDSSLNASDSAAYTSSEDSENIAYFNGAAAVIDEDRQKKEKLDNRSSIKIQGSDEDEEEEDDSDEPDEWLETIGLDSAVNFKASVLQRNSKNQQKDSLINFDNRPKSTLLFSQSSDVQALVNFLLNSKTCIMSSGPMSGIPPTLISPIAFVGATLHKNRVEQKVIKGLTSANEPFTHYVVDLSGPIMPYHVHRLASLFRVTQTGEFEMTSVEYSQSAALNCERKKAAASTNKELTSENDDSENSNYSEELLTESSITNLYLDASEARSLANEFGVYGESAVIRTICCTDGKFGCNY